MDFLGVLFNSIPMTMSITPVRLEEIKHLLHSCLSKTQATKKMLESLVGKLLIVAKCVPMARIFVGRLLDKVFKDKW